MPKQGVSVAHQDCTGPEGEVTPASGVNQGWYSVMISSFWLREKGKRGPIGVSKSMETSVSTFRVWTRDKNEPCSDIDS